MGVRVVIATLCMFATACEIKIGARFADDDDIPASCGDLIVDPDEVCDDGNNADGDGCSANCKSDETCGNGVVDTAVGETCDDGNLLGGDGCSADCGSDETCGNGVVDVAKGETCDDGNLVAGDGCSANCQSNEACGNSIVDPGTNPLEQCDDGPNGSAACNINCTVASCGDGIVNPLRNEQCEDGNNNNNDGCINCRNARCGDGFVRTGVEQCDDGNTTNGDGCNANCQFEPRVYVLADNTCVNNSCTSGQLINYTFDCSMAGEPATNPYDACNALPTGWRWQDTTPFQPSAIVMEVNHGITCNITNTANTTLNGASSGTFTLTNATGCICSPGFGLVPVLNTWTFTGTQLNGFQRGQVNTLMIDGQPSCFGLSFHPGLGGYVRITVFP